MDYFGINIQQYQPVGYKYQINRCQFLILPNPEYYHY